MNDKDRFESGMKMRRNVLGDAHVDQAIENKTPFTDEFQNFITRYAWGEIWSRPGLDKKSRSLITLSMLVALGKDEEFRMHVTAALGNGVTKNEIKETLLQCAIYCGLPAANNAFQIAQDVMNRPNGE